jgi:GTP-binding protein
MFIDYAKIYIRSGKGGNGHISFRRELYVPAGGPDGGDGGKGGDIIFEVDSGLNTLLPFKHRFKYEATDGEEGGKKRCHGKNGEDLIIRVPNGTLIRDTETNKIIYDMTGKNTRVTLLKGGKGGLGNMHFATSVMQAPRYAKPGEPAKELYITLELKVLADVGLVGFPNVGKSTFISKVTNARPEIKNYHFTTINPHLGVCECYGTEFIIADIPGIIEGAGEGVGLGFKFLKHIERTKILLHVIDIAGVEGRDPLQDLDIIMNELNKYNVNLTKKKQLIAANKIDSIDKETLNERIKQIKAKYKDIEIYPISGLSGEGIENLVIRLKDLVIESREKTPIESFESEISIDELINKDTDSIIIEKPTNNYYKVSGEKINKMLGYTNLDTEKGMNYFQKFLKDEGIIKELKSKGMVEGDTVDVAGIEWIYYD